MAYLTDDEKRLLFSALLREKKVCKEIDKNSENTSNKMLVPIIVSLQKKFKHNQFEQDIYEKAYKDGQDKGLSDGRFFGRNEAIDEFAQKLKQEISYRYGTGEINAAYNAKDKTLKLVDYITTQLKKGS